MKALLQRVVRGSVTIEGRLRGQIDRGLVILAGVGNDDDRSDAELLADKIVNLRIFEDEQGKMNLSVLETGGQILSVSQFTLYGDVRKGKRPNFMAAARPEQAEPLYERFNDLLREQGLDVQTGKFGAMMDVELVNWGPVTLVIDSK